MLVDTHTHPFLEEFADDRDGIDSVDRAVDSGVGLMVLPNIDAESVAPMRRLHDARPDVTRMAIGLHPTSVNGDDPQTQLRFVEDELLTRRADYCAIGEVGVDLYWDATYRDRQMQVFARQLELAAANNLPVIIHGRNALDEILEVIDSVEAKPLCVFHSFGGTVEDVEAIRRRGDHYFGINGIVTFKNAKLRHVLPAIGVDRILLETDAPYLAPVPYRGRRNEPAFVKATAAFVAAELAMTPEALAAATTANVRRFFNI